MRIRTWVMQLLGINNKIQELEDQIKNMERDIAGLKMEADVLYAKTLERE